MAKPAPSENTETRGGSQTMFKKIAATAAAATAALTIALAGPAAANHQENHTPASRCGNSSAPDGDVEPGNEGTYNNAGEPISFVARYLGTPQVAGVVADFCLPPEEV